MFEQISETIIPRWNRILYHVRLNLVTGANNVVLAGAR
jgi:hypothetical protein